MLTLQQGTQLVSLARKAIASRFSLLPFRIDKATKAQFSNAAPCSVTLHKQGAIRGSYQLFDEILPLHEGISACAQYAAMKDPRFSAVTKEELSEITIEITVLTRAKRVDVRNPADYLQQIRLGVDGVEIRGTFSTGRLLPSEATKNQWDALTFLRQACLSAQLKADDWQDFDSCRVYTFQSQIFGESEPEGEIIQIM